MLVLSRKKDEVIMIGESIVVTVVDIRGNKVRLGFNAPQGVGIWRNEIYTPGNVRAPSKTIGGMLVLSRHRDEGIMIGDDVLVTVVDVRGDKVRIGIKAPRALPVHRKEVYKAIKREGGTDRYSST